jgi:anaerobic selenocysteine-containing dehydrogenase
MAPDGHPTDWQTATMRDGIAVTACPLDCPDTCSLEVRVEGGTLVSVDAGPGNPLTAGFICQKVKHHARRVYAPERVLTPLQRAGRKGDGDFRPVSWDDALDLFAQHLLDAADRFGPESVMPYVYNSSSPTLQRALVTRLWSRFRASKVEITICAATHGKAYDEVFGDMLSADPLDVVHARLVVVWGANPAITNTHFPPLVQEAKRAGAKVVVVDPRRTAMAKRADLHVALRPGTDVVLALAVARQLAHTDRLDHTFLDAHAEGVNEYLAAADEWTLPRAAAVTGVDEATIAAFAELVAQTRPAFFRVGWGIERNRNGGSACVSVFALPVLTGQFGVPGAGVMSSLSADEMFRGRRSAPSAPSAPSAGSAPPRPGRRVLNMNHLGRYLNDPTLDPPIAVLFVQGSNPAATAPNQQLVHAGLARDDLFTVVHEQVLTDTARFADLVLPATTHFEARDVAASYGSYVLGEIPAVIDPVGESRTNNELVAALAPRLGFDAADYPTDPDVLTTVLFADGVTVEGTKPFRAPSTTVQFRDTFPTTASGRARLAGLDEIDVPRYRALDELYPLALISPSTPRTITSMFGEFNGPDAVVSIAPADADARGVHDGDDVRVFNGAATLTLPARIDRDLRAGVVAIPKGLWCRMTASGLTANVFAPDELSDLAGGATFNDARVDLEVVARG